MSRLVPIKWKKKYSKNLSLFYKENGLINKGQYNPSNVFISKEIAKEIYKEHKCIFKKRYPFLRSKAIQTAINFELLNLEPQVIDGIAKGYALVLEKEEESFWQLIKRKYGLFGSWSVNYGHVTVGGS